MRVKLFLVIALAFLITGCATGRVPLETKLTMLEDKVNSLQERLSDIEEGKTKTIEPVSSIETETPDISLSSSENRMLTKKEIQMALKNAGFYHGEIDGKIGKETKNAMREFQKANGLKTDGILGKKTTILLLKYLKQ